MAKEVKLVVYVDTLKNEDTDHYEHVFYLSADTSKVDVILAVETLFGQDSVCEILMKAEEVDTEE